MVTYIFNAKKTIERALGDVPDVNGTVEQLEGEARKDESVP